MNNLRLYREYKRKVPDEFSMVFNWGDGKCKLEGEAGPFFNLDPKLVACQVGFAARLNAMLSRITQGLTDIYGDEVGILLKRLFAETAGSEKYRAIFGQINRLVRDVQRRELNDETENDHREIDIFCENIEREA